MSSKQRILLKISGEALKGAESFGIDPATLAGIARSVRDLLQQQTEIAIVTGGGNLFRGKSLSAAGTNPVVADQMGMLATMMNGLALRDALEQAGMAVQLLSAVAISSIMEIYHETDYHHR